MVVQQGIERLFRSLAGYYGPLHWWPADSPWEVVLGAILTQNTAWRNVEQAIAALKATISLTPEALLQLPLGQLEALIRPAGFFRQKAERLQLFARYLVERHGGSLATLLDGTLEAVRAELLTLKGVGPETADSILLYAGGRPSFVIDAYTRRLLGRLGLLTGGESYAEIRHLFMSRLPADADLFNEYHALIVEHCKQFCRKRPLCDTCPLRVDCPRYL
ncbi:endonuclease III domain-containing protein [Desulfuromonas sp. CSMB_57]|jgi:endonuclease-3 related protein|uniref:endonuclease III domain-containing protein n=1 Tax=Desulfuromonas sp. CSMB_57 TaxID=2807629 RepID=UPI001CD50865|nr:endonuclease III domain-containing protein [Desulfuromonas sp. CSMB_57]